MSALPALAPPPTQREMGAKEGERWGRNPGERREAEREVEGDQGREKGRGRGCLPPGRRSLGICWRSEQAGEHERCVERGHGRRDAEKGVV